MKLVYQVVKENRDLREEFSNTTKYLITCIKFLDHDNDSIAYEAVLLLSVFVLMENRSEPIQNILRKNLDDLIDTVTDF
jgi:hypothetical protein